MYKDSLFLNKKKHLFTDRAFSATFLSLAFHGHYTALSRTRTFMKILIGFIKLHIDELTVGVIILACLQMILVITHPSLYETLCGPYWPTGSVGLALMLVIMRPSVKNAQRIDALERAIKDLEAAVNERTVEKGSPPPSPPPS